MANRGCSRLRSVVGEAWALETGRRDMAEKPNDSARRFSASFSSAAVLLSYLAAVGTPPVSAEACPDVEVIFARGTGEPAGLGPTGRAFVGSLRSHVDDQSLETYPVAYPATHDFHTAVDGIRDAANRIIGRAESCPRTKIVLGGYSQGAAVMGFVTSPAVPDSVDPATVPKPLQPELADNVAAVVLFGKPNTRAVNLLEVPPVVVGPLYADKTMELCAVNDPVCSDGMDFAAHNQYTGNGMIERGAAFAASRL